LFEQFVIEYKGAFLSVTPACHCGVLIGFWQEGDELVNTVRLARDQSSELNPLILRFVQKV